MKGILDHGVAMGSICVFGALGMELKAVGSRVSDLAPNPAHPAARSGTVGPNEVHLVLSGVGRGSGKTASEVLDVLEAECVICLGIAGGLTRAYGLGLVAAGRRLLGPSEKAGSFAADPRLVEAAEAAGAKGATCLTVEKALFTPEQKARAHEERGAQICDMEAWFVAHEASRREIPFLALKVISDGVQDSLPDVERFMHDGEMDTKKLGGYLAMRPDEAARAARFMRNARKALDNLSEVFAKLLTAWTG